jgi:putative hydrolase
MTPYYLSLVDSALTSVDPDPKRIVQALARAADEIRSGRNPLDDGGIVGLIASAEQRGALARVQALMSLLEGHGNSVMNKLGREHVAGQARMARVLQARRQSAGFTAFVHKLIGLESKMRQYEVGESFVAAVEREAGPRAIDAAWRGPEWLPTLDELRAPDEWLARVDTAA